MCVVSCANGKFLFFGGQSSNKLYIQYGKDNLNDDIFWANNVTKWLYTCNWLLFACLKKKIDQAIEGKSGCTTVRVNI